MAVTITEYAGMMQGGAPAEPALRSTPLSSGATSTASLLPNTKLVRIQATANAWLLFTSSGSTVNATSTNAQPFAGGGPAEFRGVAGGSRLSCLST